MLSRLQKTLSPPPELRSRSPQTRSKLPEVLNGLPEMLTVDLKTRSATSKPLGIDWKSPSATPEVISITLDRLSID